MQHKHKHKSDRIICSPEGCSHQWSSWETQQGCPKEQIARYLKTTQKKVSLRPCVVICAVPSPCLYMRKGLRERASEQVREQERERESYRERACLCVECLIGKQTNQFSLRSPSRVPYRVCVGCLFLRSPTRIPYRTELIPRAPKGRRTRTPHP